jgi:hypothetical protein
VLAKRGERQLRLRDRLVASARALEIERRAGERPRPLPRAQIGDARARDDIAAAREPLGEQQALLVVPAGIRRELRAEQRDLDLGLGAARVFLGAREPMPARVEIEPAVVRDRGPELDPARERRLRDRRAIPQREQLEPQRARQIGEPAVVAAEPAHPALDRRREPEEPQHPPPVLPARLVPARREPAQSALDRLRIERDLDGILRARDERVGERDPAAAVFDPPLHVLTPRKTARR